MNTPRDRDTVLAAWLEDGPLELPRETRQAIAVGIRTVPRRRPGIGWQFGGARLAQPNAGLRRLSVALGGAAVVVMAALALNFYVNHPAVGGPVSSADPRSSFLGTWVSTSDADGGTQTMTIQAPGDGAVEVVVTDDIATVCSGGPSTMTGTGRIEGGTALVIPSPVYTCDDGSEAETVSGPPLHEVLRDWSLFLGPLTDTLSDGFGGVWLREGAEVPEPAISGEMWPQSTLDEVRAAQELADAGDPDYTWQARALVGENNQVEAELIDRFLREVLGWEAYLFYAGAQSLNGAGMNGWVEGTVTGQGYLRCAPGRTNPNVPTSA